MGAKSANMSRNPDKLDRALLHELQVDGTLTNDQLAERVGLSASAVHRRVQHLTAAGIIQRTIAVVDPAKVGRSDQFIVGIEVERERPELVQPLRAWLRAEDCVQQGYYVTGTADYVLVISAGDIGAFDQLMSRMMQENSNVRRFTTNVVMATIKRGLYVPVD